MCLLTITSRRYFYDPEEGKCLEFKFGGCQGNVNNFESRSFIRHLIESYLESVLGGNVIMIILDSFSIWDKSELLKTFVMKH